MTDFQRGVSFMAVIAGHDPQSRPRRGEASSDGRFQHEAKRVETCPHPHTSNSRQVVCGGADFFRGFGNWLEAGSRFSATRELARKNCLTGEFACKLAGSFFSSGFEPIPEATFARQRKPRKQEAPPHTTCRDPG